MANSPEKMNNGEDMGRLWYDFSEEGIKDELSDKDASELAAEVIALRGGKDSIKNGEWNDNLRAYIDDNGMPTDYAHLVSYLKKNPGAVEELKKERDEKRNALNDENGKFTDQTYEQWQAESMRKNAENLFPDDPLAQEIASTNTLLKDETKEQFVARIRRAAEAQRIAESGSSRMETGESQAAYNQRIAEATDAAMKRENIISDFDHNRPLWPQLSDEQKREVMHAYPRGDNETTPEWQARVEKELGVPVWMNNTAEASAGDGAGGEGSADGATGAGATGEGAGDDAGGEGSADGATGAGDGEADSDGGAKEEGAGDKKDGEDGGKGAENKEDGAKDGELRVDFADWGHWTDAEKAAVLAAVMAANEARKKAAAEGKTDGAKADGEAGKKDDKEDEGAKKAKAEEDKNIDNIIAMANGDKVEKDDNGNSDQDPEKKKAKERKTFSDFGKKALITGLTLLTLAGITTGITRCAANMGPEPTPDGVTDTSGDDGDDGDDGDGETGETHEAYQFTDTYFFYNTDARGVEKSSNIAHCNAGELLMATLSEHPEYSDFMENEDSYKALMNTAQMKLAMDEPEYAAALAWRICGQTDGAYFGSFFSPDATADEVEALVDSMDTEQGIAFLAELARAQENSTWSADRLEGEGFTTGIRDSNLEGNVSDGYTYNVASRQEADLIVIAKQFDDNVQKQTFFDENGNELGSIMIRIDLENATIEYDEKGVVVSIEDCGVCGNVDIPTDTDGGTPDTPTPTPDTPTPTPTPDTPTPTPTPDTPTPTPTPDDSKKPVVVQDGDTPLQANPDEGTDAPADTAEFNNNTNNDGSTGEANYDKAPDSNTQTGAQNTNEQSGDGSGNTVAQNVQNAETNGGSNGENTSNQENRAPSSSSEQSEAQQGSQAQQNADSSAAASKPNNQQTERRNTEAVNNGNTSSIDQANAQSWANGDFDI